MPCCPSPILGTPTTILFDYTRKLSILHAFYFTKFIQELQQGNITSAAFWKDSEGFTKERYHAMLFLNIIAPTLRYPTGYSNTDITYNNRTKKGFHP